MDAEDLVVDYGRQGEVVEDVGAIPPDIEGAVLPQALVIEAIELGDLPALVVPSDEGDEVGVSHFVGQEEQEGLDAVEASVDEIPQEEVAHFGHISPVLEELEEVVELTMDVAADGDWRVDSLHVALLDQDLPSFGAEVLDFLLADDLALPEHLDLFIQLTHLCYLIYYQIWDFSDFTFICILYALVLELKR